MLYRFREAQQAELGVTKFDKRPPSANMVSSIGEADKWRRDLIREIQRKVERMSDATLTEFELRDMNDEINKLLRHKRSWEYRIKELGGPDYTRMIGTIEIQGKTVPGTKGYRYFGRALTLPGVKPLFQQAAAEQAAIGVQVVTQRVDENYFGYRDEEDGVLLDYEEERQKELIESIQDPSDNLFLNTLKSDAFPSQAEVEQWIVRRKQQELAERYLSSKSIV